jgi:ABC-type phosphate/phosphonate transport system substrate-binding protein
MLALLTVSTAGQAAEPGQTRKVAFAPPSAATPVAPLGARLSQDPTGMDTLVFSAPPRGTRDEEMAMYRPIAELLSRTLKREVVYRHADNWLTYSKDMTQGRYDLVFDGPAFNGWRLDRLNHVPLVKLPEPFVFVVITRADNQEIKNIADLAGQRICAHAPPNLGTLTLLSRFPNPARQPAIKVIQGWDNAFKKMVGGECIATVVPIKNLEKNDRNGKLARIVYRHNALPNQALSAGPRINADMRERIQKALLAPEGQQATSALRAAYAGREFVPATTKEYAGLGTYLRDELYYSY